MSKFISKLGKVHAFGEPCQGWLFAIVSTYSVAQRERE